MSSQEFIPPSDTPAWFLHAIAQPRTSHFATTADGVRIHYVCWNEVDRHKPALLFIHGYRAHAHAWDWIAPYFTEHFRVVALDLSGMGDSDWRNEYAGSEGVLADIRAVIDAAGLAPVTLVAHSFGGSRAAEFAADQAECVQRLVIVDTMIAFPEIDEPLIIDRQGRTQPYPDYASIIARYRLLPEQPAPAWTTLYMAHHSVREVDGGWLWKFDHKLPGGRVEFVVQAALRRLRVRTDYMCGANSNVVEGPRVSLILNAIGQGRPAIVIPEAHHHIMLDQPLSFISALRALLV